MTLKGPGRGCCGGWGGFLSFSPLDYEGKGDTTGPAGRTVGRNLCPSPLCGVPAYHLWTAYPGRHCSQAHFHLELFQIAQARTHTHVGPPEVHGEATAEFPLIPQLPQRELLQDFTVAPSTYPYDAGLLTLVDACGARQNTAEVRQAMLDSLRRDLCVFGMLSQLLP